MAAKGVKAVAGLFLGSELSGFYGAYYSHNVPSLAGYSLERKS